MSYFPGEYPELALSLGKDDNVEAVGLVGRTEGVGTSFEILTQHTADPAMPNTSDIYTVESDSVNDADPSGTGLRKVMMTYLNDSLAKVEEEIALTGTTPVDTGVSLWRFIDIIPTLAGAYQGGADGDITVKHKTDGSVVGVLKKGLGRSFNGMYAVPAGYTALVPILPRAVIKLNGAAGKLILRMRCSMQLDNTDGSGGGYGPESTVFRAVFGRNAEPEFSALLFDKVEEKTDFWFEAKVDDGSAAISLFLNFFLVKN